MPKKRTFKVGDPVLVRENHPTNKVPGTVREVRADGKLRIEVQKDGERTREIVRAARLVEPDTRRTETPPPDEPTDPDGQD